jgi:hypothetical protein
MVVDRVLEQGVEYFGIYQESNTTNFILTSSTLVCKLIIPTELSPIVGEIPDPLLCRKFNSAGNRTQDVRVHTEIFNL